MIHFFDFRFEPKKWTKIFLQAEYFYEKIILSQKTIPKSTMFMDLDPLTNFLKNFIWFLFDSPIFICISVYSTLFFFTCKQNSACKCKNKTTPAFTLEYTRPKRFADANFSMTTPKDRSQNNKKSWYQKSRKKLMPYFLGLVNDNIVHATSIRQYFVTKVEGKEGYSND